MEYDVRFSGVDGDDFLDALKPGTKLSGSFLQMNVGEESTVVRPFCEEEVETVRRMAKGFYCGLFDRIRIEKISLLL